MLKDEVKTEVPCEQSAATLVPRIAMEEITPGRFWVLVNFPGRTSLSLATNADRELATAVADAARAVSREALAYAADRLCFRLVKEKEGAL